MWNIGQAKGHKSIPSTVSQGWKLQREAMNLKASASRESGKTDELLQWQKWKRNGGVQVERS